MQTLHRRLRRALELAREGDTEGAQAALDDLDRAFAAYRSEMNRVRHDMGNALSIARASIEGMLDGVVPITDARLTRIRDILVILGESVGGLTGDDPVASRPDDPIADELSRLSTLADTKGIRLLRDPASQGRVLEAFQSDPDGAAQALRTALLKVIRYAPAGTAVRVGCSTEGELTLSAGAAAAAGLMNAFDGAARLAAPNSDDSTIVLSLI